MSVKVYGLQGWEGPVASQSWSTPGRRRPCHKHPLNSGRVPIGIVERLPEHDQLTLTESGSRSQSSTSPYLDKFGQRYGNVVEQLKNLEEEDAVKVEVDGEIVHVMVNPRYGPRWGMQPEDFVDLKATDIGDRWRDTTTSRHRRWDEMSVSQQERTVIFVARKMLLLRPRWGDSLGRLPESEQSTNVGHGPACVPDEILQEARARARRRCERELERPAIAWQFISNQSVQEGHETIYQGMLYGIEFPWTESMLREWGPEWLTKAFHAAGTLPTDNRITSIVPDHTVKITTGNNGAKFLFDVEYKYPDPQLHTRLFAKVPFPLTGATFSDRLSSSVLKQPNDFCELNTNRLLEGVLPVRIPKFYYGDICNATSNWILITERIPFTDKAGTNYGVPKCRKGPLPPYHIEGPYDKCLDHNLRGDPVEYYVALIRTGAMIAGMHKAGTLGGTAALGTNFIDMGSRPPDSYRCVADGPSGENPGILRHKLDHAIEFISSTAKAIFSACVLEEAFQQTLMNTMLTLNAYREELNSWKHADSNYVAFTHQNMNVDNAYFWRNDEGGLELGVFDWGGMGSFCVGHKLWWWLYCSDYAVFKNNLSLFIETFMTAYAEYGGPVLDPDTLKSMVLITAMEQMLGLIAAVPQILKMCSKKEWQTIRSRYDSRISSNVDEKSTLRLYLHCMSSIMGILAEMRAGEVLSQWVRNTYCESMGHSPKTAAMIGLPEGVAAPGA